MIHPFSNKGYEIKEIASISYGVGVIIREITHGIQFEMSIASARIITTGDDT